MRAQRLLANGFTLLELLVVLVIGSALAGVTVVGWNNIQDRLAADSTANRIVSAIQAARFQAIRQSWPVAVFLDDDDNIVIYRVNDQGDPNCDDVDDTDQIIPTVDVIDSLPAGSTVEWSQSGGLIWRETGLPLTCTGGGHAITSRIRLTTPNGQEQTIQVRGVAGLVSKE